MSLVLLAGRNASFYNDEWWFIQSRSLGGPATWWPAHNEHWVTLQVIAYRLLYETFGTGSYVPYMLALMACHVAVAAALFVLVRRIADGWAPLAAASVVLFLGSGYYNLFWGFQIGMVGALALGLWALVALPNRPWLSVTLLVAAVATQGNGLFVAAAALVYVAMIDRRRAPAFLLPFIAYAAWWVLIGSATARVPGAPIGTDLGAVLRFPGEGLAAWIGGVSGLGPIVGFGLLALAPLALYLRRAGFSPLTWAAIAALGAEAAGLALSRGLVNPPGEPHYVYLAAPFLLLVAASLRLPRWVARGAFGWALGVNLALLIYWGAAWPASRPDLRVVCGPPVPTICLTQPG